MVITTTAVARHNNAGQVMDDHEADPTLEFAAILCSRLCHDLVSPVGALANGIEILAEEDDPAMRGQVLDLLEDSARQTSNRLQFFRLAFGAGGGFGGQIDMREARKAADALLQNGKVTAVWHGADRVLRKDAVKLTLNLLLLASEALIRGGQLEIRLEQGEDGLALDIVASGERLIFNDAVRAALSGDVPSHQVDPRCAPARLAFLTARQLGAGINCALSPESGLRLSVRLPL